MKRNFLVDLRNFVDVRLKFPNLKSGGTGIQVGFDLSSKNLTSDVWNMINRVGANGKVLAVDPAPTNHKNLVSVLGDRNNVFLVQKGTFKESGKMNLILTPRESHMILESLDKSNMRKKANGLLEVQLDTLDNILNDEGIDLQSIDHINITNNGAEYNTLLGMERILTENENLGITVIAGRHDNLGFNGKKPDYEMIQEYLQKFGFKTKFYRGNSLIWWSFFHSLLLKRKWIFNKKTFGVVMGAKGDCRIPFYQSYS